MKHSNRRLRSMTLTLVRIAVIAALYAAVTLAVYPLSYGPFQVRFSEALSILPLFFPEAIPGLFLGCFLANIPNGLLDMVVGSLTTLVAAVLTRFFRKIQFGVLPPIILNALTVPLILLTIPGNDLSYWVYVLSVGAGQTLSVLALGIPLYCSLRRITRRHPSLMGVRPPAVSGTTYKKAKADAREEG